jgi:hypothetical protein
MTRIIDLDAARNARSEAKAEAPVIKLGNKTYKLPNELPWLVVEAASSGDTKNIVNAIKLLLGDQWSEFESNGLSVADMTVLLENIATIYGTDSGE